MEKKRRARINASLLELKSLLLETIKKEGARHNKMEKADILEMAVKHLRQIQKQPVTGGSSPDQTTVTRYSLGFNACVQEVSQYLDENVELKTKLLNHLANCVTQGHFPSASGATSTSSGDSTSSSYLETSPRSSSSSLVAPLSPLSSVSPSSTTLSPESQRSLSVDVKGISLASRKNLEFTNFTEEKPKLYAMSQMVGSSLTQRPHQASVSPLLRTKLATASALPNGLDLETYAVLVNPNQATAMKLGCEDSNNNDSRARDSYDTMQVPEINNNTITLPAAAATTLLGIRSAATTGLGVQQQQHIQIQPLHIQQTPGMCAPAEQLPPTYLQDASSLISNTNRLLLIPTKTSTGENAYVLSANFINPAQFSGYTIPVFNPQNQAPIFAAPFQQQAIQIAVSYSQEDQQRQTLIPLLPQMQPTVAAYPFEVPSDHPLEKQTAPLNLTSTSSQTFPVSQHHGNHRSTPFPLVTSSTVGPVPTSPKPRLATLSKAPTPLAPQIDTANGDFRISEFPVSSNQFSGLHNSAQIAPSGSRSGAFGMAAFQPFAESSNQVSSSSSTVIKQHSRDSSSPYRQFPGEDTLRYPRDKPHELHRDLQQSENPHTESGKPLHTKQEHFFRPW
ncbi:unnamed protein product [Lymnaea stagnalis]|uniref:BHLH domain-containing protein n=1 Tax=Lymnaea stagnalis TaxID=6523 RepID=A0AAV2HEU2_LYMST